MQPDMQQLERARVIASRFAGVRLDLQQFVVCAMLETGYPIDRAGPTSVQLCGNNRDVSPTCARAIDRFALNVINHVYAPDDIATAARRAIAKMHDTPA